MMTEQQAIRRGKMMAKQLGDGWEWMVWENLGWHAKALLWFDTHGGPAGFHPQGLIFVYGKPGSYYAGLSNSKIEPAMLHSGPSKRNVRVALSALLSELRIEQRFVTAACVAISATFDCLVPLRFTVIR